MMCHDPAPTRSPALMALLVLWLLLQGPGKVSIFRPLLPCRHDLSLPDSLCPTIQESDAAPEVISHFNY